MEKYFEFLHPTPLGEFSIAMRVLSRRGRGRRHHLAI